MKNHHSCLRTAIGTVAAALLVLAVRSEALDCVPVPVEEGVKQSSCVFAGRVIAVDATNHLAIIRISTSWKGPAQGEWGVVFNQKWGPHFQVGADYLVYCTGEDRLTAGPCSRTKPLAKSQEDLTYLTGNPEITKKIRASAVPETPPAPAPTEPPPVPAGLTVGLQDNGQVVVAVHTSGKTIWQVKLPAPATAARVEGNRVIVEPSGLVLDLASGKAVQQPAPGLSPDQEATPRKLAQAWVQANGKTDWGEITKIIDHGDRWSVLFTKILNQGTPVQHTAGVWIEKQTGRTQEVLGE